MSEAGRQGRAITRRGFQGAVGADRVNRVEQDVGEMTRTRPGSSPNSAVSPRLA
jgi:hypothetical protein